MTAHQGSSNSGCDGGDFDCKNLESTIVQMRRKLNNRPKEMRD